MFHQVPGSHTAEATEGALCTNCHLKGICLPVDLKRQDVQRLDALKIDRRRVKERQHLYQPSDEVRAIFAVRRGTFKSGRRRQDETDHVTGFHLPGELLGLDGLAGHEHIGFATALDDAEVCAISHAQLTDLASGTPGLQRVIPRLLGREVVRQQELLALLRGKSVEERLAAFLVDISLRQQARGCSPTEIHLQMSRADLCSYLGMKLETVSRMFTLLQRRGLLVVDKRHVQIVDLEGLKLVIDPVRMH
ncbi:oxygen-responsive transcriptional regulator Btr [Ramlibacter monticola]